MVINSPTAKAKNYYTYSASGVKLKTEQRYDPNLNTLPIESTNPTNDGLTDYKITNYVGNIIYESNFINGNITDKTKILVDGGYIDGGIYYFYLTDHLGNNRVVANANGTVTQKTHYYPFGTAFAEGTTAEQGKQPYKYNGKELDGMHGLNLYDYSARYYESGIGRFTTIDPLAEKYYSISPYVYCANNPIKYIDPTGMYFDPANEKEANKIEKNLNKQITKLNKEITSLQNAGKGIGDRGDRLAELNKSLTDVSGMRNNKDVEFRYAKASDKNNPAGKNNPTIDGLGTNTVTMYVEGNMGSKLHESRHGGDVSRGTLTLENYNVDHEVSAYRAQYSYSGTLDYLEVNAINRSIVIQSHGAIAPSATSITNINSIDRAMVNSIGYMKSVSTGGNTVHGIANLYPPVSYRNGIVIPIPGLQWNPTP